MNSLRLGDVTDKIGSGATPRGGEQVYRDAGVALIRSQNVYNNGFSREGLAFIGDRHAEELSNVEVKAGDVLLNITGDSVARVCQAPEEMLPARVNQHVAIIRPRQDVLDARFLRYFLVSPMMQQQMLALASAGATRNALTKGMIEDFRVPAFPVAEQLAIAHALGSLDDRVELNRRMNETLEAMGRTIFKSWFVDFEPVRAQAEGHHPFGMDAETAALFSDSFEDSTLGAIPKRWDIEPILGRARLLSGGTPKTDLQEYWNGGIHWASAKDVSQCRETFLVDTERTITDRGLTESATQIIPAFSTVVVARGATTGRMVLLGRDMAMNQTCYALVTTINAPFFLYCLLRSEIDQIVHAAHGSVFDTITTTTFDAYRVVLPPRSIVDAFEQRIALFFDRILANIRESSTLVGLRDALLPKLISGEIRVKNGDKSL